MFSALKRRALWLRHSSLLRLTLIMSGIFALAMFVVGVVTLFLVERQTLVQIDLELATVLQDYQRQGTAEGHLDILIIEISSLDQLPARFDDLKEDNIGYSTQDIEGQQGDWRVLLEPTESGGWLFATISLSERDNVLEVLEGVFTITAFLALIAILVAGTWLAIAAQRRLNKISSTLNALASGNLQARTHIHQDKDDIDLLARRFDQTADQLETLVSQTRNLGANIAHDLRTPLARLRANLEQAESGDQKALARVSDEVENMSQVFDAIMRIARIEASTGKENFTNVDLSELVREIAEVFEPVADDQGKRLEVVTKSEVSIFADRELLIQAIANLVQNALAYGGDCITIFAKGARIGVADNGEGVPPESLDKLAQPMFRIDQTRQSKGAGLGLAMVKAVADRHDAVLEITANQPQGLKVSLNLANL